MIRWDVLPTVAEAARAAAEAVAAAARESVADRGSFTMAVSGGTTPNLMLAELGQLDVPWASVMVFQVDERLAPPGSSARNLTALTAAMPPAAQVLPMPVDDPEPDEAAVRYAQELPERFDLIHLGIGDDGHTASLVPGDPGLDVRDRDVAVIGPYRGYQRMTLTFPVLDRARRVLWLATGAEKRVPLTLLRDRDSTIPAARVHADDQLVVCDSEAVPS